MYEPPQTGCVPSRCAVVCGPTVPSRGRSAEARAWFHEHVGRRTWIQRLTSLGIPVRMASDLVGSYRTGRQSDSKAPLGPASESVPRTSFSARPDAPGSVLILSGHDGDVQSHRGWLDFLQRSTFNNKYARSPLAGQSRSARLPLTLRDSLSWSLDLTFGPGRNDYPRDQHRRGYCHPASTGTGRGPRVRLMF